MPGQDSSKPQGRPNKRKDPPTKNSGSRNDAKRPKSDHRSKQRDARTLSTQASSKAFKNGQLDVDAFVKAREYEIRAMDEGMSRSRQALTKRAFQQVPKDLRRRTASHNVKRVPKRLQPRAKREMLEDKTPTVTARRRKPTRHMRLRMETLKKLRGLGAQRKASAKTNSSTKTADPAPDKTQEQAIQAGGTIKTRSPKIKTAKMAVPPIPKARFRKRQINKTWLPTHMFHVKRARMTPPKEPLWRFAIPLTPTAKSYRPTHRSANERGAIAWDVSYLSTIRLEGHENSIKKLLQSLGVGSQAKDDYLWSVKGEKWRNGSRVWTGFIHKQETPQTPVAPVTVIWSPPPTPQEVSCSGIKRCLFIRVHPSAFMCLWNEIVRLSQVVQPHVSVEDLRFEIGSIEITGPGATEALLGTLRPSSLNPDDPPTISAKTWTSLAGLTDPAHSPANVLLRFDVEDPRLRHPPRTIRLPRTSDEQQRLLETTATWNADDESAPPRIFDRRSRNAASTAMATQKTINRRKSEAAPGEFPLVLPTDPKVPTLIYSSSSGGRAGGSWTVLLPWKFVQPVWYSIMYYPLSTGGQPRFGGLDEKRQLSFEASKPWFPADFPGTAAGWEWELEERRKRKDYWDRRPKSKRINWDAVDTGNSKKGEIGRGWACDWERLLSGPASDDDLPRTGSESNQERPESDATEPAHAGSSQSPPTYISAAMASDMLRSTMAIDSYGEELGTALVTVGISVVTRGAPQTCARVYRLPSSPSSSLRKQWLSLNPKHQLNGQKGPRNSLPRLPEGTPSHVVQQRLARSLLETPQANDDDYPPCPPEEDLIGFVTTGNFNLSEGRGTAVGNILLSRVLDDARQDGEEGRLCIVRNAGNTIGRLARWEIV